MIQKFTAPLILLPEGNLEENKVLVTNPDGTILAVEDVRLHDPATVQRLEGTLCPGFINAHCHLELSHMKGKVDTGSGLIPFISNVVRFRDVPQEEIDEAITRADSEMWDNGIMAVGDISNKTDTAAVKEASRIDYYTFVEMFDFLQPTLTQKTAEQYMPVYESQSRRGQNRVSLVPHAPYSVSPGLFDIVNKHNEPGSTISIHNQETPPENDLFLSGAGDFAGFYEGFGMSLDHFFAPGKTSIYYTIEHLEPTFPVLFVHNTLTTRDEIRSVQAWNQTVYWATCPNANLYIENRLPDYSAFLDTGAMVCIGTDSLTSNWQLSIWDEIKTIRKYQSQIPLSTALQWGTLHGAMALGYADRLGSFSPGKRPGILLLEGLDHIRKPLEGVTVRRIM